MTDKALIERAIRAMENFRDAVLHGRSALESVLDGDQTNAVLGQFDDDCGDVIQALCNHIAGAGKPIFPTAPPSPDQIVRDGMGRPEESRRKAPWTDFAGKPIYEGDEIEHPSGERGVVLFLENESEPGDQWRVDYGTSHLSRLSLQIGSKGMAVTLGTAFQVD